MQKITKLFSNFSKFALILFLLSLNGIKTPASYNNLTKCSESPLFQKRLQNSVKKLEGRLKKYEENSLAYKAIEDQIFRTKSRFNRYSKSQLLCGTDGLPHLITDGNLNHASEFVIPGLVFLYIAGWIGWVGRSYLNKIKETEKNPSEKEIIIDVSLASKIMSSGYKWPILAWDEYINGKLLEVENNITKSPR